MIALDARLFDIPDYPITADQGFIRQILCLEPY